METETSKTTNEQKVAKAYQSATKKILVALQGINAQAVKTSFANTLQAVVQSLDKVNTQAVEQSVGEGINQSQKAFSDALAARTKDRLTMQALQAMGLRIEDETIAQRVLDGNGEAPKDMTVFRQTTHELREKLIKSAQLLQKEVYGVLQEVENADALTTAAAIDELKERLLKQGCFNVQYSNGASVGVDKYATMVCRSARTESANVENLRMAKAFGTDLVECVGNAVTCEVCAQYRGRVFSVSGQDKRYPPLKDGINSPLQNGYDLIHPNCRCEFRAYFEALHSEEENEAKRKFSNRPFEGDKRTAEQARAYQEWQAINRRAIDEQSRWNKLQAELGKDNPYKDIGALRRALRSDKDSFAYRKSHYAVRDYRQYERWKRILGEENMPKTLAEFQDLKYNNSDKFDELQDNVNNQSTSHHKPAKTEWDNDLPARGQVPHLEDYEVYPYVAKELGIDEKSAEKFADSVYKYTDTSYDDIRAYQRNESSEIDDTAARLSENIETYIKIAPRWNGGETFRGCSISKDELDSYEEGRGIQMGGTSSWSDTEEVAINFAEMNESEERPCLVIYHCDTQSRGTGIRHMSMFKDESEVLCSKDSKYVIVQIIPKEDYVHIYLKEKYDE